MIWLAILVWFAVGMVLLVLFSSIAGYRKRAALHRKYMQESEQRHQEHLRRMERGL